MSNMIKLTALSIIAISLLLPQDAYGGGARFGPCSNTNGDGPDCDENCAPFFEAPGINCPGVSGDCPTHSEKIFVQQIACSIDLTSGACVKILLNQDGLPIGTNIYIARCGYVA